jgi:hypothetical protein
MSDEKERRQTAYAHRGEVVEGAGEPVEPKRLGQAHAVSLSADDAEAVTAAARRLGMSVQDFIRRTVVASAKHVNRQVPPHNRGGAGCGWCDPLRETSVTYVTAGAA